MTVPPEHNGVFVTGRHAFAPDLGRGGYHCGRNKTSVLLCEYPGAFAIGDRMKNYPGLSFIASITLGSGRHSFRKPRFYGATPWLTTRLRAASLRTRRLVPTEPAACCLQPGRCWTFGVVSR